MSTPDQHITLDLDALTEDNVGDDEIILADMAALAAEAGDWRDHLPYEAAVAFHEDSTIHTQFSAHVDKCTYCQKLIDTLHPSDRLLQELHMVRQSVTDEDEIELAPSNTNHGLTAIITGLIRTFTELFPPIFQPARGFSGINNKLALAAFIENPKHLVDLARTTDPVAKFKAAGIYLAANHPELAYKMLGTGLVLTGVDSRLAERVAVAPVLVGDASVSLSEAAFKLRELETLPLNQDEQLRVIQLHAQLGQHLQAINSLKTYLTAVGVQKTIIKELSYVTKNIE